MATEMPTTSLVRARGVYVRSVSGPERPAGAGRAWRRLGALGLAAALGLTGLSTAQAWPRGAELQLDVTSHFDYENPGLMEEEGDLLGLAIAYTGEPNTPPGSWPLRFEGRLRVGETDYDGENDYRGVITTTGSGGPSKPAVADTDDIVGNVRLLTGAGPASTLFYGGLGFRFWDQDLEDAELKASGKTIPNSSYDRGHRYGYVPLGVRLEPSLGNGWTVHLEAEYQVVLWGEAYADSNALNERTFEMDDGHGLALRTGARYAITSALALSTEVYFQYWDLDSSEPDAGYLEPANDTEEAGVRFGINW